jgi:MurNAc alpha-1-phosphate uridylyltransferase
MVLAAGLGTRMRPLTNSLPKPLVRVHDKPLIDWALDHLAAVGVEEVVVNLHHLPNQIRAHLAGRETPRIVYSDETDRLLETGGGVTKALPLLGDDPFYVVNSDVLWLNGTQQALRLMADAWDPEAMDALLLLHPLAVAHGYDGMGDFELDEIGRPTRRAEQHMAPFVYAGVQILHPRLFEAVPEGPFSLNVLYDRALSEERLAGVVHDGEWYHVGTPKALLNTEAILGEHSSMSDQ